MKILKPCVILCFFTAGCNSGEPFTSDTVIQTQVKEEKQTVEKDVAPNSRTAFPLKEKLLGLWTDGNSENAAFEVKEDSIYYTAQFKSYKYNLIKDSITIVYDDFTFEGHIQFKKDTLIMMADEYEPQKFWRFIH